MSVTNQAKSAASTFTNMTAHAATVSNYPKGGSGWQYNQADYTYDQLLDPISNAAVYYDSVGTAQVWTNQSKHSA